MDSLRKKRVPSQYAYNQGGRETQEIISKPLSHSSHKEESLIIYPPKNKSDLGFFPQHFLKKILLILIVIFFASIIGYAGFFLWKTHSVSKRISISPDNNSSFVRDIGTVFSSLTGTNGKELKGQSDGRINILLLGAAGEHNPGKNLTDTVMIMSINTVSKRLSLLSLPRDLYVEIPQDGRMTKINSVYQYGLSSSKGIEPIKQVVAQVTGLPIHYYAVVNFDAFTEIIDKIGGVNVTVERDILDMRYPGPNYSYETFELSKGFHTLDGATALKYVRERHNDPEGDFGRAKRQQQVIQAVKNKLFSAQTLFNVVALSGILDTLGDNVKTNISLEDLEGFISLSKIVDTQNIENVVIDAWKKDSLLKVSHVMVGDIRAFVLVPRVGNYSQIHEAAENIFDKEKLAKRSEQLKLESPTIAIINYSSDSSIAYKLQKLLTDSLSMENVRIVYKKDHTEQNETFIQDNTSGGKLFSLDELIKKLPAKMGQVENQDAENPIESDFIIAIGNDLVKTYAYEEDSMEEMEKSRGEQEDINLLTD